MAHLVIIVLVLTSIQQLVDGLDFKVTTIQRCLLSETYFLRLYEVTRDQCVSECSARRRCLYVSYRRTPFISCHLFEETFPGSGDSGIVSEAVTCTYVQRSDILTDLSTSCNCSDREVCDPDIGSCSIKECNFMANLPNGIVLGNMNSVGSTIKFECNNGYEEIKDVQYSTCNNNGEWSYLPRCLPGSRLFCGDRCQGSSYLFVTVAGGRNKAMTECESTGGTLATISSSDENTFLKEEAERLGNSFWTGLKRRDDNAFAWDDGSPFDFSGWGNGQPDGFGVCVRLKHQQSYYWAETNCRGQYFYICEYSAE